MDRWKIGGGPNLLEFTITKYDIYNFTKVEITTNLKLTLP